MAEEQAVVEEQVPEEKPKKKRATKPEFEAPEGVEYPYKVEMPEGYKAGEFASLKKKDFDEDYIYMLHRAACLQQQADKLRTEAEELKKLGGAKQRAKAKKLIKMRETYAALQEQLKAQGIDVDALLAAAK